MTLADRLRSAAAAWRDGPGPKATQPDSGYKYLVLVNDEVVATYTNVERAMVHAERLLNAGKAATVRTIQP